jgi:hypothetical protein
VARPIIGEVINNAKTTPQLIATQTATNYYFGGKLVLNKNGYVRPTGSARWQILSLGVGETLRNDERHREVHRLLPRCRNGLGLCGESLLLSGHGSLHDS